VDGGSNGSGGDDGGVQSSGACGLTEHPAGGAFFLPDGVSTGTACGSNAPCSGATPNCVEGECHASFASSLNFTSFAPNQQMTRVSDIVGVCANMEHEWIRDLEIQLQSPSGQVIKLVKFVGRTGGEVYLGEPLDCDSCSNGTSDPMGPHVGYDYCWKPTATTMSMLDVANANSLATYIDASGSHPQLPAGDYQAADPWTNLIGSTLDGPWQLVITDLWAIDVGHVHSWKLEFDPNLCGSH
jgi:hypothetical protein